MPTIHDLRQSKFLSKAELAKPILCIIVGYEQANVAMEGQSPELRWVLKLNKLADGQVTEIKPMVVNSVNGQIIGQITGSEDFDGWIGHKVVIFFDPTIMYQGQLKGGIRVRAPRSQAAAATVPAAAPTASKVAVVLPKPVAAPAPAPEPPFDETAVSDPEGGDVPF